MKIPKKFRFQLVRRRGERSIFSWPRASYRKEWGERGENTRGQTFSPTRLKLVCLLVAESVNKHAKLGGRVIAKF